MKSFLNHVYFLSEATFLVDISSFVSNAWNLKIKDYFQFPCNPVNITMHKPILSSWAEQKYLYLLVFSFALCDHRHSITFSLEWLYFWRCKFSGTLNFIAVVYVMTTLIKVGNYFFSGKHFTRHMLVLSHVEC